MKKYYWYYAGIKVINYNQIVRLLGTQQTDGKYFDFVDFHNKNGIDANVLMVQEIDEKQFNEMNKMIDEYNK